MPYGHMEYSGTGGAFDVLRNQAIMSDDINSMVNITQAHARVWALELVMLGLH